MLALTAAPVLAQTAEPIPARYQPRPYVELTNPDWSRDAVIYQINTRQFTSEGTFRAAMAELPRLKALGVDILWLMPIHPIGVENRKGTLGSPYAVRDYFDVNPEFGTQEDFKAFVDAAHAQGMRVILDGWQTIARGTIRCAPSIPNIMSGHGTAISVPPYGSTVRHHRFRL